MAIYTFILKPSPAPMPPDLHQYLRDKVAEAGFDSGANQSEFHLDNLLHKHSHLRSIFPDLIQLNIEAKLEQIHAAVPAARSPETEFDYRTIQALRSIRNHLSGFDDPLPRQEIAVIEGQWQLGKSVLLSGDSGTGKSGIAAALARNPGKPLLLLDARSIAHLSDESALRQYFGSVAPLSRTIINLGQGKGFRLVIDQLDSLIGTKAAGFIISLALECAESQSVEVLVVSRNKEAYEARLLRDLTAAGFVEIESRKLREEDVERVLAQLGINQPSPKLVELGQNLLNLELICCIRRQCPEFVFPAGVSEPMLWEQYLDVMRERDGLEQAEQLIATATDLARMSLRSGKPIFVLSQPIKPVERRLESWGVIVCQEGRTYRFGHEKLQGFLYARYMCEEGGMPDAVKAEIGNDRMRNILPLMGAIYRTKNSSFLKQFLQEVFDV